MTRKKVKVRIEQQREKQPAKQPSKASVLRYFINKETLIAGGALAIIISCSSLLIFGNDWQTPSHSTADANTVGAETIEKTKVAAIAPIVKPKPPVFPREEQLKVGQGDTLLELLTDTGVSQNEAYEAVAAIRKIYDPRRINSGQQVDVTLKAHNTQPNLPSLSQLTMPISGTATIELHKIENGKFVVKKVEVPVTAHPSYSKLSIQGSLYQTARRASLSPQMIMDLMKGFSHDVDFQRDVQRGHQLEVVVDELRRDDGTVVGTRNLRYAKLTLGRKKVAIYRYEDSKGNAGFYDAKGESLKRGLLRTPVDGARISSRYGKRKHPVLGYRKMHKGVDFAAPRGTPIYAAADGVIQEAGRKGSYGNYVRIKHNSKYSTAYAHAKSIRKGIRKGRRVTQGQIIAYVGTTGRSTGPHLHYEVLAHGKQVNPANVQKFGGNRLAGKELKRFNVLTREVNTVIASADKPEKPAKVAAKKTAKGGA